MGDETADYGPPVDPWADEQAAAERGHAVPFGDGAVITAADIADQQEERTS